MNLNFSANIAGFCRDSHIKLYGSDIEFIIIVIMKICKSFHSISYVYT